MRKQWINGASNGFFSNAAFIAGLQTGMALADPLAVFRHVFMSLERNVVVYPTENYYYFTLAVGGKVIWGSLSLYAHNRDQGILGFGYSEKTDKFRDAFLPAKGGGATLSLKDGVKVKKVSDLQYRVSFAGRTVTFHLNHEKLRGPDAKELRREEVFVGPSFDESGLKFFLVFNRAANCLYWVLNERDGNAPCSFTPLASDLIIEDRTEYAFYVDTKKRRKVLVGVEGFNVLQNNWYDGPFDQMPDNYVYMGEIEVQKYLEASYPHLRGKIDKYGNYLDQDGSRIAVAPYMVYFYRSELAEMLNRCKASNLKGSAFLAAITRQIFKVPPEFTRNTQRPPATKPSFPPRGLTPKAD